MFPSKVNLIQLEENILIIAKTICLTSLKERNLKNSHSLWEVHEVNKMLQSTISATQTKLRFGVHVPHETLYGKERLTLKHQLLTFQLLLASNEYFEDVMTGFEPVL